MKIMVIGPTGGTGDQIVRQALSAGYEVIAVARRPDAVTLEHHGLQVCYGDVLEPASLNGAMDGVQAVLFAVGPRSSRKQTSVYSRGIRNVRAAMNAYGIRRLIAITAFPVSPPEQKNPINRLIIDPVLHLFFGGGYDDAHRMEADFRNADDVDWTIFRPPRLIDGPATGDYRIAVEKKLSHAWQIRRADLAAAMIDSVDNTTLINRFVNIAN